jgi:hypothetical protein
MKEIDNHFNFNKKKKKDNILETLSDQRYPEILLKKLFFII